MASSSLILSSEALCWAVLALEAGLGLGLLGGLVLGCGGPSGKPLFSLIFFSVFLYFYLNSDLNSYPNSFLFCRCFNYVNSLNMECNDYFFILLIEDNTLYFIKFHTCGLLKIAIRHEFLSSF
jgi:hypothetical protein